METKTDRSAGGSPLGDWNGPLIGGCIGALIGALFVGLVAKMENSLGDSGLSETRLIQQLQQARTILTAWDVLALPVLGLIVLGTHEIGHVLGGLSQGMRFLMLIVGPFGWHATVSGTRFQWNTNLGLMGGLAATLPRQFGDSLRRQLLVMIAGGPLFSLLLAISATALATISDPRFAAYCTFIGGTSFGIFLVTLLPLRTSGFMSDGRQLIDVLKGGSASLERHAQLQILAQSLDGIRPRDWDSWAIDQLSRADSTDPQSHAASWMILLARAMDCRHDAEIAHYQALLEKSVAGYPAGFRQSIHVELAICAWLAGDTDAVRRHLKASQGGIVEESRRLLANAALAKLEGRDADCERDRLLAIQALADASDAGQSKLTEDQLAMLALSS